MKTQETIAVLASGGLDSAILIHNLLQKRTTVRPLYIQGGHVWENTELFWLRRFLKAVRSPRLKPLVVLSLKTGDLYDGHWSLTGKRVPGASSRDRTVYLPGKNILLIAKAAVFCALQKINFLALGPLETNPFPDAQPSFFKTMEKVLSAGLNHNIKILTPFLKLGKKEVMALGVSLPLHLTFSCLSPRGRRHCGKCNKCAERKKAFRQIGVTDPTHYHL